MSRPENPKVLAMGVTAEAVAHLAPATTLLPAEVTNIRRAGVVAEETTGMETIVAGVGHGDLRATPMIPVAQDLPGAVAVTPHQGAQTPRSGNGRGPLISINLEN